MKSSELRQQFLSFFEKKAHTIVASSPLVPGNDPTLLFTNAGMVQFKETFLGQEKRSYTRATSAQRCVRAGGKHNDLENVGYTARHHTFFEMLGNFSFGDYFKREAIAYAWEFLTKVIGLPEEKLWVTVYKEDKEAEDIWLNEMKVSKERFSRCGEKDNFWSMGDTGPCGPCSEIFYDHGPNIPGGPPGSKDEEADRYIEIWNLVFMQYDRHKDGSLTPLPKPSVDTGMGLERLAAVVQGVHNNYDIDLFQSLIASIMALAPKAKKDSSSLKVIADHIRSCAFLIVDGVIPGNEGRGYVLRRIIRRAARHGHQLGLTSPFFYTLTDALVKEMGQAYPELTQLKAHIKKVLLQEEEQFARTLEQGLKLLNQTICETKKKVIEGALAFKLYDTYGFPFDLTADIAKEHGLKVDEKGFDKAMSKQRKQSQAASDFSMTQQEQVDLAIKSQFCGYEKLQTKTILLAILKEGKLVEKLDVGGKAGLVLKNTSFYAESGGQIGDKGVIKTKDSVFKVVDTQKINEAIVHYGVLEKGALKKAMMVTADVDSDFRQTVKLHHSATHLLHAALKNVLGSHVQQKGSLVTDEKTRFDFSHYQALTKKELWAIEALVNKHIRYNYLVTTELMSQDEAIASGAVALFGEKYGEKVRVLTMGEFSKELCGGTHVTRTGDIGFCKITNETGIASGIRRIEMVAGEKAQLILEEQDILLNQLAQLLKGDKAQLNEKVGSLIKLTKQLEKETMLLKNQLVNRSGDSLLTQAKKIDDVAVLAVRLDNVESKSLRTMMDTLKNKLGRSLVLLAAVNQNKMNVVCGVSKDLLAKISAKDMVQHVCGKGGGRDDMAQGGGPLPSDLASRLADIHALVEKAMSE